MRRLHRWIDVGWLALLPGAASAMSVPAFDTFVDLSFARGAIALERQERARLDALLAELAAKGFCSIEAVLVYDRWSQAATSLDPQRQERGNRPVAAAQPRAAYLRDFLATRKLTRVSFSPEKEWEGTSLAGGAIRLQIVGRRDEVPCAVHTREWKLPTIDWEAWQQRRNAERAAEEMKRRQQGMDMLHE